MSNYIDGNFERNDIAKTGRVRHYNKTNTCERIKENGDICGEPLVPGKTRREYDKDGNETGRWLCYKCRGRDYQNLPDSHNSFVAANRNVRTGNIGKKSEQGKTIISQAVVAKYLGIEDLNIKMDNYSHYIDMEHERYGKIDVKYSSLMYGVWWLFNNRKKIDCDTNICIGLDKSGDNIESVFFIPNDIIMHNTGITIARSGSKYDEFKVDPKIYNDLYHSLTCCIKGEYFSIELIKHWMEG